MVVYFSWSGNNRDLSELVSEKLGCPAEEIVEKKKRTFFTLAREMIFKKLPILAEMKSNLRDFDHVILVSPVWGGKPASPMIAFIDRYAGHISKFSFITICGGSQDAGDNISVFLENRMKKKLCAYGELHAVDLLGGEEKVKPNQIMGKRLGKDIIAGKCKKQIDAFAAAVGR